MKRYLLFICGLGTAGMLCAAEAPGARLSAPVLGYVFDETAQSIRAISGIPGAASLGEPVAAIALERAFVHSLTRTAVGVSKEGQAVLVRWAGGDAVVPLDTELAGIQQVTFSNHGAWAALSDGFSLEVWSTGVSPELLLRHHAEAGINALAVSDAGAAAFADSTGTILRVAGGEAQHVAGGGTWSALTFDGEHLLAADALHNELLRFTAAGGRLLEAGLPGTVFALVSGSGGRSSAALDGSLLLISPSGVAQVECGCRPRGLARLEGGAVLVAGTNLVMDGEGDAPRLTHLPNLFSVNAGGNQ